MKILSADIRKLIGFRLADIRRLEVEFRSDVVIVMASNGYGKSSLLKQLTPTPPVRSDYEPGGYKRLIIEHQGSLYILTSDFSNKGSPHSFVKDDTELNDGGTTDVQAELVASHLGFNQKDRDVLAGRNDFCNMPSGLRRTMLIESNPANLGFILDHHKKVSSRIRACKNNLTMLQERKILLESKFLDDAALQALRDESLRLNEDIEAVIGTMGMVRGLLSQYKDEDEPPSVKRFVEMTKEFRRKVLPRIHLWKNLNKAQSHDQLRASLAGEIEGLHNAVVPLHTEIVELTGELSGYQDQIKEITETEAVAEIKLRIKAMDDELNDLKALQIEHPVAQSEIGDAEQGLSVLNALLQQFLDCSVTLLPQKVIQHKTSKYRNAMESVRQLRREYEALERTQRRLNSSQKIRMTDIPDQPCAKYACPLYVNFKNAYDEVQAEIMRNTTRLRRVQHRLSWAERYVEAQGVQLDKLQAYQPHFAALHELLGQITAYRQFFKGNVLKQLQTNPMTLFIRVDDYVKRSIATYRIAVLQSEIVREGFQLSRNTDSADTERQRLEDLVNTRQKRLNVLKSHIDALEARLAHKRSEQALVDSYHAVQNRLQSLLSYGEDLLQRHKAYQELKLLHELLIKLDQHQKDAVSRLGAINATIREQDTIKARYTEEVLDQINTIEHQKKEWEDIEKALAKIPHLHTVSFINALIASMNAYIAKVFTYDFRLLALDPEKALDYKFSVMASDVMIPDISCCSEGQQEMINIAYNLAQQKLQMMSDYPIYLDESGRTFGTTHKQRLIDLLRHVLEEHLVSQMFLVSHHALVHEGLANAQTLVLSESNVLVPAVYNQYAVFNEAA